MEDISTLSHSLYYFPCIIAYFLGRHSLNIFVDSCLKICSITILLFRITSLIRWRQWSRHLEQFKVMVDWFIIIDICERK